MLCHKRNDVNVTVLRCSDGVVNDSEFKEFGARQSLHHDVSQEKDKFNA